MVLVPLWETLCRAGHALALSPLQLNWLPSLESSWGGALRDRGVQALAIFVRIEDKIALFEEAKPNRVTKTAPQPSS